MRNKKNVKKMCPFFDELCKGNECMIYHEQFEKCGVEISYMNMYSLKEAIKDLLLKLKPITDS